MHAMIRPGPTARIIYRRIVGVRHGAAQRGWGEDRTRSRWAAVTSVSGWPSYALHRARVFCMVSVYETICVQYSTYNSMSLGEQANGGRASIVWPPKRPMAGVLVLALSHHSSDPPATTPLSLFSHSCQHTLRRCGVRLAAMSAGRGSAAVAGLVVVAALAAAPRIEAHGGHKHGPVDDAVPIDTMLYMHMVIQMVAWFFLFPLALVMGLTRHRLHVPVAITALSLTAAGFVLGQRHGGRTFPRTAHGTVASIIFFLLLGQAGLGTYLKMHLTWRAEKVVRPWVIFVHSQIGKLFVILGWVQMVLGVITLRAWCRGGATGQCLAHHIMGSAFIGYAIVLLIMLKAGVDWLRRRGMSQEMLDSSVIFLWGCVNALTEHHGGPWTHKDLQHTLLGVVWAFGGAAGMWTSRRGQRSVIPAVVVAITGWAMSGHAQALVGAAMESYH